MSKESITVATLCASLFALTLVATAQPPPPILVSVGGAQPTNCAGSTCRTNSIPFNPGFANDYRFQLVVDRSQLPQVPSVLTDVSFVLASSGTLVYAESVISVGHADLASVGCNLATNSPDLTQQYSGQLSFTHAADQWSSLGVPFAFPYDGVRDLLIQLRFRNHVSGSGGSAYYAASGAGANRVYNRLAGGFNATNCSHSLGTIGPKVQLVFQSAPARVNSIGSGCGTPTPALVNRGLPSIGNAAFGLVIQGGTPARSSFLFLALTGSRTPTPLGGGCGAFVDLPSVLQLLSLQVNPIGPITTDANGDATFPLPVPSDPGLFGTTVWLQGAIDDPLQPLGFSLTNAVELEIN